MTDRDARGQPSSLAIGVVRARIHRTSDRAYHDYMTVEAMMLDIDGAMDLSKAAWEYCPPQYRTIWTRQRYVAGGVLVDIHIRLKNPKLPGLDPEALEAWYRPVLLKATLTRQEHPPNGQYS